MGEIKAGVTLMQDFCRPRTEKFQEYIDYMDREEAQRNNAITTYNLFNEYMGNPYKSTGLFTAEKDSLTLQEKKHLKKVFSIAQTNQSLMWQTVISFDNNWLQKNGIYDMKTKMLDERKLKAVTRKAINELLKNEGLDQAVWSASIHYNTDNIHVHIATVEPYPMRKKMMYQGKEEVRGKFKLSNINHCKSVVINEIVQTREMNLRINTIIRKDIVGKLKEEELTKDSEIKSKFLELCQNLPEIPKNRMNYGNKEMRQYRAVLDEISEKFLKVYSSEKYYELREILDRQSLLYTEAYGGDQGGNYKKNKLQELKEKMGNAVLKQAKDYIECMNNKVDVPNFGMKEKTNEEMPVDLAQLEEIENVFIINEQEQLIEEIESVEQVDEAQEIAEKEYDLKLSVKPQINISETLQKELDAAKVYFGEESSENIILKDNSEEYSEDLMQYYVESKEIKALLKQALGAKENPEKQNEIFNLIQNDAEKKNNPFIKELLGEMYLYGNLVEVNLEVAREYFAEALEIFETEYDSLEEMRIISRGENKQNRFLKNHVAFCIGKQYDRGWGTEEAPEIAFEWYENSKTEYASYALGRLYYNGRGVEKDDKMAFAFFQNAGENAFAKLMCAKMLEKEGQVEKSLGYYKSAFDLFSAAEEKENSALFEYHIGSMLYYGKGCEPNEKKAVEFLRKAVEEKNVPAILLLSNIYYEKGILEEIPYMIEHLEALADKTDNKQAQYTLGKIYLTEGEFYNLEKGISYLERSASQGNEFAKYRLSKEYLNFDSKAYSPVKGITYLRELAEGGYEWAQFKMGCEYIKGEHVEKDDLQAEEWLRKAVDQGNVPAILLLSNIYYKKGVLEKIPYMIEHLKVLSDKADNMQAQYTLGKIYLKEGEFYNLEKGISYLERSASQGNEYAKYQLAKEYLNSDSEAYNPKKGMAYLSELAEGGNEWAQLKMGCEYIKGKHVEKNYFQATEWLNKSAVQGNKYAEEILNDLNVRQLKTNRYGSQRRKRYNTMGALDKAMVALRRSLYETQKEMRYNMMIYEQDIRAELDGYALGERRG